MVGTDATVRKLAAAVAKVGATLEARQGGRMAGYEAVAPVGFQWACESGVHVLVSEWNGSLRRATWPEERADAIADLIERVEMGLEACPPDCDCRDE